MDQTKRLIERLVSNPVASESEGVASELLAEYQRGSPIESLRILLSSADDRVAGEGAWIASELSDEGKPLIRDVRDLLAHRAKKVRFWALDCVLLWAGSSDGHELASAVALVDDAENAVRWKAMGFLSMASREQLQAAYAEFKQARPDSPYARELKWLLDSERSDAVPIIAALRGNDSRRRRFAAAAAFRMAKSDSEPLRCAASVGDPEIAQFAGDMLKRLGPF
jgi:hypothetical protein